MPERFKDVLRIIEDGNSALYPSFYPPYAAWNRIDDESVFRSWKNTLGRFGIYISIPFCDSICSFCCFPVKVLRSPEQSDGYLRALDREAGRFAHIFGNKTFSSILIGGGTPSILKSRQIMELRDILRNRFSLSPDAEITFEANPEFLDGEKLKSLKRLGVNWLSIGVQSLDDGVIRRVNRSQTNSRVYTVYMRARDAGIPFVNIDLLAGLPGQSGRSFLADVREVAGWRPDEIHLGLFLPTPSTSFYRRGGRIPAGRRQGSRRFWEKGFEILQGLGYSRTEEFSVSLDPNIRNKQGTYAFYGATSILGLGLGALSYAAGGIMYQNTNSLAVYSRHISEERLPVEKGCQRTSKQKMIHFILSSLEHGGKIECRDFESFFGERIEKKFGLQLACLGEAGVLKKKGERYVLLDHPGAVFEYSRSFFEPDVVKKILCG